MYQTWVWWIYEAHMIPASTMKWASPLNDLPFCLKPLQHHRHTMVYDTLKNHLNPTLVLLRPAIFHRKWFHLQNNVRPQLCQKRWNNMNFFKNDWVAKHHLCYATIFIGKVQELTSLRFSGGGNCAQWQTFRKSLHFSFINNVRQLEFTYKNG